MAGSASPCPSPNVRTMASRTRWRRLETRSTLIASAACHIVLHWSIDPHGRRSPHVHRAAEHLVVEGLGVTGSSTPPRPSVFSEVDTEARREAQVRGVRTAVVDGGFLAARRTCFAPSSWRSTVYPAGGAMVKLVFCLRRRSTLSRGEVQRCWPESHG